MKLKVEKVMPKTKDDNHKKTDTKKGEKNKSEWKTKLNGITLTNHEI